MSVIRSKHYTKQGWGVVKFTKSLTGAGFEPTTFSLVLQRFTIWAIQPKHFCHFSGWIIFFLSIGGHEQIKEWRMSSKLPIGIGNVFNLFMTLYRKITILAIQSQVFISSLSKNPWIYFLFGFLSSYLSCLSNITTIILFFQIPPISRVHF